MTNNDRLSKAKELVEQVWNCIVPDRPPITVAEDEYFDMVDDTAERILSDIERMHDFVSDMEDAWR